MKKEIKLHGYKSHVISHEVIEKFIKDNTPTLLEGQEIGWFSFGVSGNKHQAKVCIYDRRVIHIDTDSADDLTLVTLEHLYLTVRTENLLRKYGYDNLEKIILVNQELKKIKGFGEKLYYEIVDSIKCFIEKNGISSIDITKIM